ncbi:MAG: S-layer homology domain-containing protein [Peptostreptococcaceae bacterium]|nr:S-layer homology domain-containing protein [Peptostreptococcaceae bacterium]
MKRKIGIGILVLTLCISSFALAFADINYNEWNSQSVYPKDVVNTKYFTSVKALTDKKVITGDITGLYYPEKSITRAEFSVMMAKATYHVSDLTAMANLNVFNDLTGYTWAKPYINAIYQAGIIKGVGNSNFAPGNNVSYIEVIAMIMRSKNMTTEIDAYGVWPDNYIFYSQLSNMTGQVTVTDWNAPATKGDVALIMYRNMANLKPSTTTSAAVLR